MSGLLDKLQKQYCPPAIPATPATPAILEGQKGEESQESQESQAHISKVHFLKSASDLRHTGNDSDIEGVRHDLERIACTEGLPALLLERVLDADLQQLATADDDERTAFLLSLEISEAINAGRVPKLYTQKASCEGCGSVWLWIARNVNACPWCARRAAGKPIPRPPEGASRD